MPSQLVEESVHSKAPTEAPLAIKNILCATDFSDASLAAFPYLDALAERYGSQVHVAHVVGPGIVPVLPQQEQQRLLREAESKMQDFLRRASKLAPGRPYRPVLQCGEPSEMIRQIGQEFSADLVVLGTNGRRGLKRFMLGSVAEEIFRLVPWPVLTVGPKARNPKGRVRFHRLLFATDLSPASVAALPRAFEMAQQQQAVLTLLTVARSKKEAERARTRLQRLIPAELAPPVQVEALVQIGSPVRTILKTAGAGKTDLIILGVRSGGAWDRAATHAPGPIAYHVIAQAPCPVLTIREPQ